MNSGYPYHGDFGPFNGAFPCPDLKKDYCSVPLR